jgi:hypothetical protein
MNKKKALLIAGGIGAGGLVLYLLMRSGGQAQAAGPTLVPMVMQGGYSAGGGGVSDIPYATTPTDPSGSTPEPDTTPDDGLPDQGTPEDTPTPAANLALFLPADIINKLRKAVTKTGGESIPGAATLASQFGFDFTYGSGGKVTGFSGVDFAQMVPSNALQGWFDTSQPLPLRSYAVQPGKLRHGHGH